jgi:hypothetical protein
MPHVAHPGEGYYNRFWPARGKWLSRGTVPPLDLTFFCFYLLAIDLIAGATNVTEGLPKRLC